MANEYGVDVAGHTILSRLGKGGMAAVYLAREERLGRLVAVKVIDERLEQHEEFQRRFEREARTAASLTHPNIVPVYQYGFTADGRPYLSMAFIEGGSLRDRLRVRGALPVDEALTVTRQVAAALLAAHSRNIVHRDLKPDNVLFQGDTALLADFGIAKVMDASTVLTGPGSNPGTVRYFSPEQAKEHAVDQRSDIYTLGAVLYEMLTGKSPIEGDTVVQLIMRIAQQAPEPLPAALRGLQPFLDVLLAKAPADRLGSCSDVIAVIQAMERNLARFGELDRITDGVAMTPSGTAAPGVSTGHETVLLDNDANTPSPAPSGRAMPQRLEPVRAAATQEPDEQLAATVDMRSPAARKGAAEPPPVQPRRWWVAALAGIAVVVAAAALWQIADRSTVAPPTDATRTDVTIAGAPSAGPVPSTAPSSPQPVTQGGSQIASQPVEAAPSPQTRADATVQIDVEPFDARVLLPELALRYAADTRVPAGPLKVRVLRDGYVSQDLTLQVRPGELNKFEVILQRDPQAFGSLNIRTTPGDAKITLLGVPDKYRPGVSLPVGALQVLVQRDGFEPIERSVRIGSGNNEINIELARVAAPTTPVAPALTWDKQLTLTAPGRSQPSSASVQLVFYNLSATTVQLAWIDFEGVTKPWTQLAPNTQLDQQTFSGHLWRLLSNGEVLAEYRATEAPQQRYEFRSR